MKLICLYNCKCLFQVFYLWGNVNLIFCCSSLHVGLQTGGSLTHRHPTLALPGLWFPMVMFSQTLGGFGLHSLSFSSSLFLLHLILFRSQQVEQVQMPTPPTAKGTPSSCSSTLSQGVPLPCCDLSLLKNPSSFSVDPPFHFNEQTWSS